MRIEQGQVAVVTGAASGIGYGLAEALAARGVHVVLSDVQTDAVERAAATLAAAGATTLAVAADVGDADQVGALAAATIDRFGRVDLVCNNAGVVSRPAPMWEQGLASWRWLIDVALLGVVHGVHHFVPHLIRQGGGHVLNTASVGGLMPLPTLTPYNAVKHAVIGLTETLDLELRAVAPTLGASVLCPGPVATALSETSRANRPAGARTPDPTDTLADRAAQRGGSVLLPADVARIALEGVEADRVHILTNPETAAGVRARVEALLADVPW
ncbi:MULTISPECIES: SDR family NAD(P)-dependent oxidoreductase [Frankia]|uniref:Short chain dehydrogenase n=1 Tax=Frankia alni (strain DSM 45986 / CECT 9034 / ACN14a) TaxID=326424 RepID=Q0RLA9_FRAAA|nr:MULTISPECIES: SDR family NAD(P)-dependent oxidoreductase [Frankia]CAJ61696.1 putative short chain dehydrogenase [Frankia alni ACN14a]